MTSDEPTARTDQRFLLLTGTAPGEPGVGGIILRDLVKVAGIDNCRCCWLAPYHSTKHTYLKELETTVQTRRYETAYRPLRGFSGELISAAAMRLMRPKMIRKAAAAVESMIQSFRPRFLLAILESPAAIQVAMEVHRRTRIPLRAIVWDDVDLFCRQGIFDRWTRSWLERSFQQVLKASERIAVISENMHDAYLGEHGVQSMILRHGVSSTSNESNHHVRLNRDYDIIGFAGSNTAPDCLQVLIRALDDIQWRLNGRDIALRMLGARYLVDSRQPQRIEHFGWRSVQETRQLLSECNWLYLPQSFATESHRFSELSFPTKLSTYVAARRPIFLHAPDYASLSGFWRRFELGPSCQNLVPENLIDAIQREFASSANRESDWLAEIERVHEQVLSPKQFEEGVRQLVG